MEGLPGVVPVGLGKNSVSSTFVPPSAPGHDFGENSYLGHPLARAESSAHPNCSLSSTAPARIGQAITLEAGVNRAESLVGHEVTASPVTVALDSGATASCFRQREDFRSLACPV